MKHLPFSVSRLGSLALGLFLLTALGARAQAGDLKLEAVLIWGTNSEKSPDPNHKAVNPKLEAKLKKLPFKWQHFFEVNRKEFTVAAAETKKITMSKDCEIKVRRVDAESVEVELFGKGQRVSKISQKLPKGECLVTGGNAADSTGWFVVLRPVD